jgi:hypothetical protein
MDNRYNVTAWILAGSLLALGSSPRASAQPASVPSGSGEASAPADEGGWPRQINRGGTVITIYQPQLDNWSGNQLTGRAAVAVQTAAAATPTYGVIWFSARTEVDRQAGTVTLVSCQITKSSLPTATGGGPDYVQLIHQNFGNVARTLPIEQLEAHLAVTQAENQQRRQPLRNDPPRIIFSTTPAVLVLVDGPPALRQVAGTNLLRVINTRALILLEKASGKYYLYLSDRWVEAASLQGPWSPAGQPPASLDKAKQAEVAAQQVDLLDNLSPEVTDALSKNIVPAVYVSTTPAELVQTNGAPDFQPIAGTNLLWAQNSESSILMDVADQNYYVTVSGRWFRARSLTDGAWSYVPGTSLPPDFAQIPASHPAGDALPAVPGTPQAEQSLIEQSIPQTATVRRDAARLAVTYDGRPQFVRIEGTSLQRAVNTPTPVIRVNGHSCYACENGVWFTAGSPTGPWAVATSVPEAIYTIPISSPVNYVTHAAVYGYTPDVVYVGYTPGYLGTYISPDNCVVFGSGYPYHPWIGSVWFGAPITYGLGVAFDWDAGFGWEWGFGWGAGPWLAPWWGPWWGHWREWDHDHLWRRTGGGWIPRPRNINQFNVFNHWSGRAVVAHSGRPGQPGNLHAGGLPFRRSVPGMLPGGGSNLFAGRDGRVYRRGANGWEMRSGSGWRRIRAPNPAVPGRNTPGSRTPLLGGLPMGRPESPAMLDRDAQARSLSQPRAGAGLPNPGLQPRGMIGSRPPALGGPGVALNRPGPAGGAFGGFGRRGSVGGGGFGGPRGGGFGGPRGGGFGGGFGRGGAGGRR